MPYTAKVLKRCTRCNTEKPVAEFSKNRTSKDGLQSRCKPCHRAGVLAWQKKFPEKVRAKQHRHDEKVRGSFEEKLRRAIARDGRLTSEEKKAKRVVDMDFRARAWMRAHPRAGKVYAAHTLGRKHGAAGFLTLAQLDARWAFYGGRCYLCRDEATEIDHVIALSAGGANWPSNIRPICRPCNSSKKAQPLAEYLAS